MVTWQAKHGDTTVLADCVGIGKCGTQDVNDNLTAMSPVGTFQTWRDVRVESVMRSRADMGTSWKDHLRKKPRRPSTGLSPGERRENTTAPLNGLCHDSALELLSSGSALASKSLESAARSKPRRREWRRLFNGNGMSQRRNQKRRCAGRVLATWASDSKRRGWRDVQAGD
jgi:hypothetical protein